MLRTASVLVAIFLAVPLSAQPGRGRGWCCATGSEAPSASQAPIASNPVVEITGVVNQAQLSAGQGVPYLEVKGNTGTTRVYLGPIHYLIAENFSPKAGQEVTVRGYRQTDSIVAIQVSLAREKVTIKLRDDSGWPLWRGGPWRGGRGRLAGRTPSSPK